MRITDTKINGINNPLGFATDYISCSWKVEDSISTKQANASLKIAVDEEMKQLVYQKNSADLRSIGQEIDFNIQPRTRYYYQITVEGDKGDKASSKISWFESAKKQEEWIAKWITTQPQDTFHPVFERNFEAVTQGLKNARLYISGLGLYEAYLNEEKVGQDYLAPFCNDYGQAVQYQTYDVTQMVKEKNHIAVIVGNGWYKGRFGLDNKTCNYGDKFAVIAELHLEYADGNCVVYVTDESWTYRGSDIESSGIYDGECFNRLLWKDKPNSSKQSVLWNNPVLNLVERYSLPVIEKEFIQVKEVIHTPAGETVIDFGQNFTGYVCFENNLPKGSRLVIDFGEILQNGNFYNENLRSAQARFTYVSDGRKEEVRPHFTYFGFRYVRISGLKNDGVLPKFMGKAVYSDLTASSSFNSSNDKLNKLVENCIWGQKSNFLDMPTDCPQRDERLGWTGDVQVFAPTACYHMDTRAFFDKYLTDLRIDQLKHNGEIANFIPNLSSMPGGSSVWGDVAVFLPMTLYYFYGDKHALAEYFSMMKDWVDYIIRTTKNNPNPYLWTNGFHFGDWLALDGITPQSMKGATEDGYVASMYYYKSASYVSEAAGILGFQKEKNDYKLLAENIKSAILDEYFTPAGRLAQDTQTGYLLSLRFGIYRDKQKIIDGLKSRLKKDAYKIKGGFVGATTMCQVLAENDMEDLAYYFLLQEGYPGWLHTVNLGATTIWERWNSVLDDGSISGTGMNSLNHYAYGSVMEFVYRFVCGINATSEGFRSVCFAPKLCAKLKKASFSYDSVSGRYTSEWEILNDGQVSVRFSVPFGCHATAKLPGLDEIIELETGVFEKIYKPKSDLRNLFTMDSRLGELAENEQAMKILEEKLPVAYGLIKSQNIEHLTTSLNELQYMNFMGFTPQSVQNAAKDILEIKEI